MGNLLLWRLESRKQVAEFAPPMKFQDILQDVATFHTAFKIPNADQPHADLTADECALRHRLMAEENDEYLEAAMNGDLVEVADALGDQLYILAGTMMRHGMQDVIERVFQEIQSSNMSKLGEDGQPILREDGKVMKGPNYFRPDIATILKSHEMVSKAGGWKDDVVGEDLPLSRLNWSVKAVNKLRMEEATLEEAER